MNNFHRLTAFIVLIAPAVIIAYDIVALFIGGRDATITAVVRQAARHYHELPWVIGGLFFWLWLHFFGEVILERLGKNG